MDSIRRNSLTTCNNIMSSNQEERSRDMSKEVDGNNIRGGCHDQLEVPVATPTPTSFANTRNDIRSQMKSIIPPLPMMTTPPQTPLVFANAMMDIGSWKVSTPPSTDALRALYQSSRRSGTPFKGITSLYHPGTFPPLPPLFEPPNLPDTFQTQSAAMLQNQQMIASVGSVSMMASAKSLLDEDWASLFRNISTGEVANQGNGNNAYAAPSHSRTTEPTADAAWHLQRPLQLDSTSIQKESMGADGNFQRSEDNLHIEPPTKKTKTLGFCDPEEYLAPHRECHSISSNDKLTSLKHDVNAEHEDNAAVMNDGTNEVNIGPQDKLLQPIIQQPTTTQVAPRSEREQHIISRKIHRLLLIRHCSTCPVPIDPPPPPPPPIAISGTPLSFPTNLCGPCNEYDLPQQKLTKIVSVCPVTSHCAEGKALCAHVLSCKLKNCTYRGCLTTREVLGHHLRCREKDCEICSPVRVLDQKRRYRDRIDDEDAKMNMRRPSSIESDEDDDGS